MALEGLIVGDILFCLYHVFTDDLVIDFIYSILIILLVHFLAILNISIAPYPSCLPILGKVS